MGYNVSAYIERKNEDGTWTLASEKPVSSSLKYILDDFKDNPSIEWDGLSEGLKEIFKKEDDGKVYYSFYSTTIQAIEDKVSSEIHDAFTKLNVIVKALGCQRVYGDDGEEMGWGEDEEKEKLTFPISKQLVEDLQYGYETMRRVGQREAFDLIASEAMEYGKEYRIILVVG